MWLRQQSKTKLMVSPHSEVFIPTVPHSPSPLGQNVRLHHDTYFSLINSLTAPSPTPFAGALSSMPKTYYGFSFPWHCQSYSHSPGNSFSCSSSSPMNAHILPFILVVNNVNNFWSHASSGDFFPLIPSNLKLFHTCCLI